MSGLSKLEKYQAAVLLNAYLRSKGTKNIENKVSSILRNIAKGYGLGIDNLYMTPNECHFELQRMESAYQGRTIVRPAKQSYLEIVKLYKRFNSDYVKLLNEAMAVAKTGEKLGYSRVKRATDSITSTKNNSKNVRKTSLSSNKIKKEKAEKNNDEKSCFIIENIGSTNESYEKAFLKFLKIRYNEEKSGEIVLAINNLSTYCINKKLVKNTIFEIKEYDVLLLYDDKGEIFYKYDVRRLYKYYPWMRDCGYEGIRAWFYEYEPKYLYVILTIASDQSGILAVINTESNRIVHYQDGSFARKAIKIDDNVITLYGIYFYGHSCSHCIRSDAIFSTEVKAL